MKNRTTQIIERWFFISSLAALLLSGLSAGTCARATSVDTISANVNAMRQLTPANIVQMQPGNAPYYGPAMCQQLLPVYEKNLDAFDPAYTCTCPSLKAPPKCQGPAHFATATTTCSPETPFGSTVAPPLGGPNPQPQDWAVNQAIPGNQPYSNCAAYGACSTSYTPTGMTCEYPANSNAAISSAGTTCAALGLTTAWLTQYASWGVYQSGYSGYGYVTGSGYPNVCVVAVAPVGSPPPPGTPAPTAANPLPWPYVITDCANVGQPNYAPTAAAETCQVFQATCSPTWIEGYQSYFWSWSSQFLSLTGNGLAPNFPPSGYSGWDGPFITQGQVGGGPDVCAARYACTGQPQSQIPIEMSCWGSEDAGPFSEGFFTASVPVPSGSAGGSYPNYVSTTTYAGPDAVANWGCSGANAGVHVPTAVQVSCSGPVCTYSILIASSGSCTNHIYPIQWNMYRDNYLPICPSGTAYNAALNLCTN